MAAPRTGVSARFNADDRADEMLLAHARQHRRTKILRCYLGVLLAEHELELARIAVAKLEAKREHADARLTGAALRLERSTLRAPFAGIVVARSVEAGQAIVSRCESRTLVVLADSENFIARTALDAPGLINLRIGQEVPILVGNLTLTGKIAAIAPEPLSDVTDGPHYQVDVLLPRPGDGRLRVGQGVTLTLP